MVLLQRSYLEITFILLFSGRNVSPEEYGKNFDATYRIMHQLLCIIYNLEMER